MQFVIRQFRMLGHPDVERKAPLAGSIPLLLVLVSLQDIGDDV